MTAQVSEVLIYKGERLALCEEPLSIYMETVAQHIRLDAPHTALWRGYVGVWEIKNDRLYLVDWTGYQNTRDQEVELTLNDLFPGYPDGVFAHWYTGELRCPRGALLDYVHGGFASRYEEDLFLKIENGLLVSERVVVNGKAEDDARQGYAIAAMTTLGRKKD